MIFKLAIKSLQKIWKLIYAKLFKSLHFAEIKTRYECGFKHVFMMMSMKYLKNTDLDFALSLTHLRDFHPFHSSHNINTSSTQNIRCWYLYWRHVSTLTVHPSSMFNLMGHQKRTHRSQITCMEYLLSSLCITIFEIQCQMIYVSQSPVVKKEWGCNQFLLEPLLIR